jgi:hypothetical protein
LTVEAIWAAQDWMEANGFDTGSCSTKSVGTLHMEHLNEVNNVDDWDVLFQDVTDWLYDFTYDELVSTRQFASCSVVSCID